MFHVDRPRAGLLSTFACAAILGSFACVSAIAASEASVDGIVLALPGKAEGWERKPSKGGGVLLQKSFPKTEDAQAGVALIQLLPPNGGSFQKNFDSLVRIIPELAEEKAMTTTEGLTVNGHAIRIERRCCAERQEVDLDGIDVGIDARSRQVFVKLLFLNVDNDRQDLAEKDLEAMIRSLRPTKADRAFELAPLPGGGGLDGLYTYLDTGIRPNVFGGTEFYSESRIMALDPAGLYSTEIPKGGEDIAAHCRSAPADCGLYRLKGGGLFGAAKEIEMQEVTDGFGVFEAETRAFAREGDDLVIGERDYRHVPPIARGTRLDGAWRYFFALVGQTATSSQSVASERVLTLRPDGSFERTGFSSISSTVETGSTRTGIASGGDRPVSSGRYEIDGYGLTLTGTDGRRESLSLFRPDGDSDGLLVIDGNNYLKAD